MTISPSEVSAQTSEYEQVRQDVLPLLELDGDDFAEAGAQFVASRLKELEASAVPGILNKDGNFQGFLGPDFEINAADLIDQPGFVLDDPEVYSPVMPTMQWYYRKIREHLGDPDKAYRNAVYATAQHVQELYFSNPGSSDNNVPPEEDLRDKLFTSAADGLSIAAFKGVAKCSERAAVANNVMQLFGVNPVLEMGSLKIGDDMPIPHTFLLVPNSGGETQLFDPANPSVVFDEKGKVVQTSHAIYPIEDQMQSARTATVMTPAEPITVTHKNYHMADEGQQLEQKRYQFAFAPGTPELRPY